MNEDPMYGTCLIAQETQLAHRYTVEQIKALTLQADYMSEDPPPKIHLQRGIVLQDDDDPDNDEQNIQKIEQDQDQQPQEPPQQGIQIFVSFSLL